MRRGCGEWHLAWLASSLSSCCTPQTSGSLSHNLIQVAPEFPRGGKTLDATVSGEEIEKLPFLA